uniref:Uncharacterized protein n=1 Tax=Strigamia maritima TaxID=126957 RepID=T1J490_STRMM
MSESETNIFKLSPSQYSRLCQLQMSPDEILSCIRVLWASIKSEEECDAIEPYPKNTGLTFPFVPSLPVIVVRAREINSIELRPISFRNDDLIPHSISIAPPENASFKIISPLNYRQKVAPGMSLVFHLRFEVLNCEDYYTEIKCTSTGKILVIPVFGIGPRAYLDLPDTILFPSCPTLLKLRFDYSSFHVNPTQCVIPVNSTLQIEIEFNPQFEGESHDELLIHYETGFDKSPTVFNFPIYNIGFLGERVYVQLDGISENINIRLGNNTIPMDNTYIGLKSVRQISLINSSDISCHFKWSKFSTREEEQQHSLVRISDDESFTIDEEHSGVIKIEPMEGEVWQNTSQSFNVIFSPEDDIHYEMVMYCDVIGREVRLPLKIFGVGKGPTVSFVTSKIDIGKILVGTRKNYEIVLKNDGLISASYHFHESKTLFGRYFTFIPEDDVIKPSKTRVINVAIQCAMLGDFYEEFLVEIEKSRVPLKLIVSGACIGPTLAFEARKINLGHVALGFPTTKLIDLENKSAIPVRFHLRVIEDNIDKKNLSDYDSRNFENSFLFDTILDKSVEITVKPDTSDIEPLSSIQIEVKLIAKVVKHYKYYLIVDIQGVGKAVTSVSIFAKSEIPKLSVVDNNIIFDRCFLDYPYEQSIQLKNESEVSAVYRIKTQSASVEKCPIRYKSSQPEGIIEPKCIASIPITITPKAIGILQEVVNFTVTGQSGSLLAVPIKCTVCGPVVDVQPEFMDWGMVPVLLLTSKTIQIINLCPIPAVATASMDRGIFVSMVPAKRSFVEFRFQDKVIIKIMHSVTFQIPVWVKTFGTTIGIDPPITDPLVLNPHFSNVLLEKRFTIINHGRKSQQLYWTSETGRRGSSAEKNPAGLFRLIPAVMELSPGQSLEFTLQAFSDKPQKVMETFSCFGTKGRTKNKELVMQFEVHTQFIAPSLQYSTTELTFKVCKELENLLQPLSVTNVSALPLTLNISVKYPFQILLDGNNNVIPVGHSSQILVNFDPNYVNDKVMRSVKEELKVSFLEHPQVDIIPLNGFVYFANLLFDKTEIDFDIVPIGLEWRQTLTICNTSPFQVYYKWFTYITAYDTSEIQSTKDCQKFLSILPMRGVLHPGDEQEVTILFNAENKVWLEGIAVCSVDDGPSYPVRFVAQASELCFNIYPTYIAVGNQVFNEIVNVKVTLTNTGDVGFRFSARPYPQYVDGPDVQASSLVCNFSALIPTEGTVAAHQSQVLNVKILPAYPWDFKYEIWLDIAHLEPSLVTVVGNSVFPFVGVSVNESEPDQTHDYDMQSGVLVMNEFETCITACLVELKKDESAANNRDLKSVKYTLSSITTKVICVLNRSDLPISFKLEVEKLNTAGFYVDIDQVKQLPPHKSVTFLLTFNPFTANIPLGEHSLRTNIKISNGIPSRLHLCAVVTKPKMKLSAESIEFGEVQCSQCKVVAVQLHNDGCVPCEWECILKKPKVPAVRKSKHHGILNPIFYVHPPNGFLRPKERMNIEIRFIPHEDAKNIYGEVNFQAPQKGVGVEPNIILRPQVIIFDPVLPNSRGCEREVIIENPCNFPIEMYSIEFDKQFIEEDMHLRLLPNYDELDSTLIPIRHPGENFPCEFNKYYTESDNDSVVSANTIIKEAEAIENCRFNDQEKVFIHKMYELIHPNEKALLELPYDSQEKLIAMVHKFFHEMVLLSCFDGDIEDPVEASINSYLGPIKFPNGVVEESINYLTIVIFGPPKTVMIRIENRCFIKIPYNYTDELQFKIVSALAEHYNTKAFVIDNIVKEAIISGESQAAVTAREFCRKKAAEAKSKLVRTSVVTMQIGDEELSPTFLPNTILTEVIRQEIRGKGYESGLIIASLECNFCPSIADTITALLTAFSKKRHLYFISLHKTFSSIKENETRNKLAEYLQNKRKLKDEVTKVEAMSEDEYDNLSADRRVDVNRIIDIIKFEWFLNKQKESKERRASRVVEALKSKKSLLDKMNVKMEVVDEMPEFSGDDQTLIDMFTEYEKDFDNLGSDTELKITDNTEGISLSQTPSTFHFEEPKDNLGYSHVIANISTITDPNIIFNAILSTLPTIEEIQEEIQILRNNVFCAPPYLLSVLIFPFQTRMPIPSTRYDFVGHGLVNEKIVESGETAEDTEESTSINILLSEKKKSLSSMPKHTKYAVTRWIIPPRSSMALRIRFKSTDMGQFDRILHFELLGCRRRYQLFCRGTCRLPDIHREPFALFGSVKKPKHENEIADKIYVVETKTFEFGPVLLGKVGMINDSLRIQNTAVWNIVNTSGMTADITFSLITGTVFQVEPSALIVPHGVQEKLRVNALPMEEGHCEDTVVFTIKDNPDAFRVKVSCVGTSPVIELEPRLLQTEALTLSGEAYDVAVDITFPRGAQENLLDFGYLRVREDNKLSVSLKNKGKYDILYKFDFLSSELLFDTQKLLSISPSEGRLGPNDKTTTAVQFTVMCTKELTLNEVPLAMCKLIEPAKVMDSVVAEIPIKVTLRAQYSRYKVRPEFGINFGPLVLGSSAIQLYYILNTGPFNFTYDIYEDKPIDQQTVLYVSAEEIEMNGKTRSDSPKSTGCAFILSRDLTLNMDEFSVYPYTGVAPMGKETSVNVICSTESPGKFHAELLMNIGHTDTIRDVKFPLYAEVCIPRFESKNLSIIFEEHVVCQNEDEAKDILKATT